LRQKMASERRFRLHIAGRRARTPLREVLAL
jgi:hypothetical protein